MPQFSPAATKKTLGERTQSHANRRPGCFYVPHCSGPETKQGFNDAWRSADGGATWEQLTGVAPWAARTRHAMSVAGASLVLAGGCDGHQ
eukprot:gene9287-biopygen12208